MEKQASINSAEIPYDFGDEKQKSKCCCLCTSPRSFIILIVMGTLAIVSGAVFMPMFYDALMKAIVNDVSI